jgi:pyrroline-5-carboxylate reductase
MGAAVLRGLASNSHPTHLLSASTRSEESAKPLRLAGITAYSLETGPDANQQLIVGADAVVLGVKPYQVVELLKQLAPHWRDGQQLISMVAGVTLQTLRALLPGNVEVVRTMPNTPSQVGSGVTGIVIDQTPEPALATARYIFGAVGSVVECRENQLDWLSAISGSGPAYVFFLVEKLEEIAREQGFSNEQAQVLVRETISGAMLLLASQNLPPQELRRRVTSPNGTTERAIAHFEEANLPAILQSALAKAVARAGEIAQEQSQRAGLG